MSKYKKSRNPEIFHVIMTLIKNVFNEKHLMSINMGKRV